MLPLIVVTTIGIIFLIRAMLILIGLYKTPILRRFEDYGPEEKPYLPILAVMLWSGVLTMTAATWAGGLVGGIPVTLNLLGVLVLMVTGLGYNYADRLAKYHWRILKLPHWYYELIVRTNRFERRRIGYMWLHLPLKLRLTYNSSDKQFFVWADFVIMGSIREEELKPGDEEFLYTGR